MICSPKSDSLSTKKDINRVHNYPLDDTPYYFTIHNSIHEIEDVWSDLCAKKSIFLSVNYFKAIEACPPDDLQSRYLLLRNSNDEIVAFFPCQLKLFEASDSIKDIDESKSVIDLRKSVAKRVKFHTLIGGNITVSGEYMCCFLEGLPSKRRFELTEKILDSYREILQKSGHPINVTLLKDVHESKSTHKLGIDHSRFKEFGVEPLMVLRLNKEWETLDDYMASMTSKYRTRVRRTFKKGKNLRYRECDLDEIIENRDLFYKLYMNVFNNVDFSLFQLSPNYFAEMKRHLGENFRFFVVSIEGKGICAFYTLMNNNNELHAHYLGYDPEVNRESLLYLNMLYHMVELGIKGRYETIDFGRTALEIKSSVGAEPQSYSLYLKHKNQIANLFVPSVIGILNKKTEWIPRSPFK